MSASCERDKISRKTDAIWRSVLAASKAPVTDVACAEAFADLMARRTRDGAAARP